ncbi:MAG: thiamine diphosphokinase [Coriobacteriia bacterium]|nr:thiamine diphosphokinase [Coriobacteriia bacterium]
MSTLVVGAAPACTRDAVIFYRELLAAAGHVVAADGAGEWCIEHGRSPDLVIGDFDSAAPGARERLESAGVPVLAFDTDKDETDLELGVAVALQRYGSPITLTAAFTGRLDHTLAALGALTRAGAGARALEPEWGVHLVCPGAPILMRLSSGVPFALQSPAGADGVTITGGRWPLRLATLEPLSGRGVSNEALGGPLTVSVEAGAVLLIVRATPTPAGLYSSD